MSKAASSSCSNTVISGKEKARILFLLYYSGRQVPVFVKCDGKTCCCRVVVAIDPLACSKHCVAVHVWTHGALEACPVESNMRWRVSVAARVWSIPRRQGSLIGAMRFAMGESGRSARRSTAFGGCVCMGKGVGVGVCRCVGVGVRRCVGVEVWVCVGV